MRNLVRDNGLSLVLLGLFAFCWLGQAFAGWRVFEDEQGVHGALGVAFLSYLASPHFLEATAENWESEFLQMSAYVILTVFLYQRGSAESKDPDGSEEVDDEPAPGTAPRTAPWPVRRGGWVLELYRHSLSLVLLGFFLLSFLGHAIGGHELENLKRLEHGELTVSLGGYVTSAQFWFESFQNWQSEFLAVLSIVILSIFLRQKGSPESKPLAAPHARTG